MLKNIHTILLVIFSFSVAFSQQKTQINPVPRGISSANYRIGCSLFTDPNNYSTGSSFSYNAPVNNNSNLTTASGTNLGCMYSVPNQAWFIITVNTGGNLYFNFSNSNGYDVDAVIWGPISGNDVANACASTQNYPTTCDWDAGRPDLYINGAQVGQKYVMLVTNYSNANTVINISQPTGGGVTYAMVNLPNCSLVPTATISGTSTTVTEGQSANLTLNFTGSSPWNYTLSDGTVSTAYNSPVNVSVFPTASQTYTINSVNNLCGTSGGSGSVGISVTRNVLLKTCLPLDGNASDSQGINSGSLQNRIVTTTNRNSESGKALQFDGIDDYVSLTANQLNNNTFAFATWVKLDELPSTNNPENIAISVGGTSDEHFLGAEYYNGNPTWKFSSNGNNVYSNAIVDLNWHLLVGVRTGGQIKLYVDGILTGTESVSGVASYGSPLSARIGSSILNNKFFKGKIDDVKIFSGSLIEPEILLLQNYNSCNNVYNDTYISVQSVSTSVICTGTSFVLRAFTNNIVPDGQIQFTAELSDASGSFANPTVIGSSQFLPLTVTIPNNTPGGNYKVRIRYGGLVSVNTFNIFVNNPATYNIVGTVALNDGQSSNLTLNFTGTGPWNYIMSDGLSGVATTSPWLITVTPDQSTTYSISSAQNVCGYATVNGNSTATVSINYTKQFVTCLPFTGNASDTKSNNTATVNGPILTENRYGQTNTAYSFNGSGNYIEYTTNLLRKREYTMSAWVMVNSISGSTQYILSQGESGTNTFQGLGVNSSGWFFQSYSNSGQSIIYNSTSLATNQWVHLTAVRTYQSLKLYVNGNLVTSTNNSSIIPFKTSDIGRIGANSSTLGNYFNGKIDDVKLYKGALNDEEVYALYANTNDCPTVENSSIIVARSISPATVCAGNNISVAYSLSNVNVAVGNPLTVQLSDANGSFGSPTVLGTGTSSPVSVTIPANTTNSNYYRVRLVSAGNVISVNSLGLIVSGSLPTATISGGGSIPFGGSASLTINFTGTAPWTYALNNGTSQIANTSPTTIAVSPYGTTTYTVTSVSNTCGAGTGLGSAVVNVAPNITINNSSLNVCANQSFNVSFSSNISNNISFTVELSNSLNSFINPTIIGSGQVGNIICSIPENITLGNYKVRIKNGNVLSNEIDLILGTVPVASISGIFKVEDGTDIDIPIQFSGQGPYNFVLSNGFVGTTTLNLYTYAFNKPKFDQLLTVQSISNSCGTGSSTGSANVDVIYTKKLISCFNLDNNALDLKGNNNGLINGAIPTTDRFGNSNSAMQFDGINDFIQFPINELENQNYTYSAWVMPFSLPYANSSQETSYRSIVSVGSQFRQHAIYSYYYFYEGYPSWRANSTRGYYTTNQANSPLANQWYHLTMVSSESELKLYINGILVGSSTYSRDDPENTYLNTAIGMIGGQNWPGSTRFFHGKIDDVRIFRGALNDSEVSTLFNSTSCEDLILIPKIILNNLNTNAVCQGSNVSLNYALENLELSQPLKLELSDATGNFSNSTILGNYSVSPLSFTIPNNIIGQNYKVRLSTVDNSIVSNLSQFFSIKSLLTASISGSTTINEGQQTNLTLNFSGSAPYSYSITGGTTQTTSLNSVNIPVFPIVNTTYQITSLSNACGTATGTGSAIITVNPIPIRLVSCFPFNGNANDSKGLNNGTNNGATLTNDRFGNVYSAYSFDGINSIIEIPTTNSLNSDFTHSFWFKPYLNGGYEYDIFSISNQTNSYSTLYTINQMQLPPNGDLAFTLFISTNNGNINNIDNVNIITSIYNHFVITKSNSIIKAYLNGILISTFSANINSISDSKIYIGGRPSYGSKFFGLIDDVQIYKGALTSGQVQALYQNTDPCFDATTYTCLSDNIFTSILSGQQTLQVSNQIIGRSSVQSGANIHFDSKNSIVLEPGFKTESNTVFKATVGGGCN